MADRVEVRLNKFDIRRLSVRHTQRVVDEVVHEIETMAKVEALGPYATGATAASIHGRTWAQGSTVRAEVTAGTWYSRIAHGGAKPHPIPPRAIDGTLVFFWRKVGHVVRFKRPHIKMHPGYAGKHFLSGPARTVGRRHRFIVITYEE
jgi:hypothetical protein